MRPDRTSARRRAARRGVVLLDVILAMAVIALGAFVLLPAPRGSVGMTELQAEGIRVAATFREGRAAALRSRKPVNIAVDPERRVVSGPRGAVEIRQGVAMVWVTSDQCPLSGGKRALRYLPDGRSCGGVLTLSAGGASVRLRVDWLTGRVDMSKL